MDSTTTNAHHRNRSNSSPHSNEGDAQRHSSYTHIHCLPRIDTPTAISPRKSHSSSEPNTPPEQYTPKQTDNHNIYSSIECGKNSGSRVFFTPARIPTPKKSASSPLLHSPPFSQYTPLDHPSMQKPQPHIAIPSSGDDDDEDGTVLFTSRRAESSSASGSGVARLTNASLRTRLFGARDVKSPKTISTTPGQLGAGETETEADEPPKHLPTSRIHPPSSPLVPPNTLQQKLTPLLFETSRLLSIVPAVFGVCYNLFHCWRGGEGPRVERIDYFVSALWAVLTGYQCLSLTTGLLHRWVHYYPPLPTLIRLLALQAICWPATHITLLFLGHRERPVVCWCVVGTCTCVSRSVQIWVTSNLWLPPQEDKKERDGYGRERGERRWKPRFGGGKWGGRRWDWGEVGVQCMLPAGCVYFVMAWAEVIRREVSGC